MSIKTTDVLTSKGRQFMAEMYARRSKPAVKVGILQKDFEKPEGEGADGVTVGEVAVANEFGVAAPNGGVGKYGPVGGIPERSFIRSTADDKRREWQVYADKLRKKVIDGSMNMDKAMGLMGLLIQRDIQRKIRSNIQPANAPSTIRRKGSSHTLIDTGQMLNSIAWELFSNAEK